MPKMADADLIVNVRQIRRMITTLDSIGLPMKAFAEDEDLENMVSKEMFARVVNVSRELHRMLVELERNQRYKTAVKLMCKREDD